MRAVFIIKTWIYFKCKTDLILLYKENCDVKRNDRKNKTDYSLFDENKCSWEQ